MKNELLGNVLECWKNILEFFQIFLMTKYINKTVWT